MEELSKKERSMSSASRTSMLHFLNRLLSLFAYASRSPAGTDLAAKYISCNVFAGMGGGAIQKGYLRSVDKSACFP